METLRDIWEHLGTGIVLALLTLGCWGGLLHSGPDGWAEVFIGAVSALIFFGNLALFMGLAGIAILQGSEDDY